MALRRLSALYTNPARRAGCGQPGSKGAQPPWSRRALTPQSTGNAAGLCTRPRLPGLAFFLVIGVAWVASAGVQELAQPQDSEIVAGRWRDLALTKTCEVGFQRFIQMAQAGMLGSDVTNANVGVFKNHARVELVRSQAPNILLQLTPKQSTATNSRYFTIEPGEGATASDVVRVARALDEAFSEDPFELAYDFFNASRSGDPIPGLGAAWVTDGSRGVLRALSRQVAALVSLTYTIAVLAALAMALVASLLLLWGSTPPRASVESNSH
jgi:hypothetical protein